MAPQEARWIASRSLAMTKTAAATASSRRKRLHFRVEIRLALEADARQLRHDDVAVVHADAVGEAAIGLEQVRIAFIAAEAETGRDVERHLVAAMRDAAARRPAMRMQDFERALIFAEAIGQRAIELQPVAVRAHAAIADEIARVLMAEQVFAGRHRRGIELRERGLERVVEGIAGLLVPEQRIVPQHLGVGD